MNKEDIYNYCIENLKCSDIRKDEPMSKHTSFKIGGNADIFIKVSNIEELKKVIEFVNKNNIKLTVIGNGSNILVKDKGIRGITIKLEFKEIHIQKLNDKQVIVTAGAGVLLGILAQKLLKESISGFEFASGIPGSIGGALKMNAGAYGGEFKDIVISTKCIDKKRNIVILNNKDQNFSYRHSTFMENDFIILESQLLLNIEKDSSKIEEKMKKNLQLRKINQPLDLPNAGSIFKRGENFITSKLIDDCGLKGFSIGGAQISEIHAGFIVNKGNASAEDVLNLIEYVTKKVLEKYNKKIKPEIEVLGE